MGFDRKASRAIMAPAWEETSMRKLIGLSFLTATLLATSAHAQGIFIDRGDPSAISAAVGASTDLFFKDRLGASLLGGWTYRGVFDVGAEFNYYMYKSGDYNHLTGLALTPFVTLHAAKVEEDEWPISLSFTLGVQRIFYTGNAPVANPEGWGVYVGPSVYRRFELGSSLVFVPEVLVAYDFKYTRHFSGALDQGSGYQPDNIGGKGKTTDIKHNVRVIAKPNLLVKMGNTKYLVMPYVGYQDGPVFGGNLGALF
jgi:hypothetical protein